MEFKEIRKNLKTQNGRATADPIFVVYDWEKIPSHPDYTDESMFVESEGEIGETREDLIKYLKDAEVKKLDKTKDMSDNELIEWLHEEGYDDIDKVYYIKKRIFVNVFFTEESANRFIKQNHYHYSKDVHTYVHCLWRNPEMNMIRDALIKGKFNKIKDFEKEGETHEI